MARRGSQPARRLPSNPHVWKRSLAWVGFKILIHQNRSRSTNRLAIGRSIKAYGYVWTAIETKQASSKYSSTMHVERNRPFTMEDA